MTFELEYKVRLDDIDYMGIVGNATWLTFLERARVDIMDVIGYPMTRFFAEKIGAVVSDLNIKYKRPALFGHTVKIRTSPETFFSKGVVLRQIIENVEGQAYVEAQVTMVFVDSVGLPIPMPEEIKAKLTTEGDPLSQLS